MAYVDYEYYKSIYGEKTLAESDFKRIVWNAEREIDKATSGVDGVRKLQVAFPTNEYDVEAVKRCVAELVNFLYKLEEAENNANSVGQYIERADGGLQGKVVASVSAGNESISYAVGKSTDTSIGNAIKDSKSKGVELYRFISGRLQGIADANGVSLLYGGPYPCVI